jgi:hypothetical protein
VISTADTSGRALRGAAVGFALATAYGSAVAIRENLPGEPLGLRVPFSVRTGIWVGWGAAVAAPWPMPVAGLLIAARSSRTPVNERDAARPGLVCAVLGLAGIVGIFMEPNTYKAQNWCPATRRAALLHVATSVALVGTGKRYMRDRRGPLSAGLSQCARGET